MPRLRGMAAVIASLLATMQLLLGLLGPHVVLERAEPAVSAAVGRLSGDTACARWVQDGDHWECPDNVWRVRIAPAMDFAAIGPGAHTEEAQRRTAIALTTVVHELAHVYDGTDDGMLNGSPGHARPDRYVDAVALSGERAPWEPPPWYCWAAGAAPDGESLDVAPTDAARAEWYACEVARTGQLQ